MLAMTEIHGHPGADLSAAGALGAQVRTEAG